MPYSPNLMPKIDRREIKSRFPLQHKYAIVFTYKSIKSNGIVLFFWCVFIFRINLRMEMIIEKHHEMYLLKSNIYSFIFCSFEITTCSQRFVHSHY